MATAQAQTADTLGRRPKSGLLPDDLRLLHLAATENSHHWEMPAQVARHPRRPPAPGLATDRRPQTPRQTRWADSVIRTLYPQPLSSR
ncbi:hypothetical protein [Kitasatospora sp. DSM 101779]|uniref:hypothetical protein n=1 Tax=Kitasatospora sp. DSM 101779 TaxID=2853165 RepID=UPI0021DB408B|nr:hypothetical protein [Kitasatospora sp. DSM 101779]MCU7826838.1 hypothetical protein [Kitasatospora sp. DSM 101779]